MNLLEFEAQLSKIGKVVYVFSHSEAYSVYVESGLDAESVEKDFGKHFRTRRIEFCWNEIESEKDYLSAFEKWSEFAGLEVRFHCVEICDGCDLSVSDCNNKNHLHEWGLRGYGFTLHEAFANVIEFMKSRYNVSFTHLVKEIPNLRDKVKFWNNAWHEQRLLTGKNFWMEPYKR